MSSYKSYATLIGYSALLLWACSGVLASSVVRIPTFEVLAFSLSLSFIATCLLLTWQKRWHIVKQSWVLWVTGILGIFGNDAFYVAAFKHAPPAQSDLISYLYPILIIVIASFLPSERFSSKYIIAGFLGFFGTYLLITAGGTMPFNMKYFTGYCFALLNALAWSIFCVASHHYRDAPIEMIGLYCGCGVLFSLVTHFFIEPTVIPNLHESLVLITMGLATQGSAYYLWDYGVKYGNFNLLSILAYGNPIMAVILLIISGKSHYSHTLLEAALLISAGGALAGLDFKKLLSLIMRPNTMPRERHD